MVEASERSKGSVTHPTPSSPPALLALLPASLSLFTQVADGSALETPTYPRRCPGLRPVGLGCGRCALTRSEVDSGDPPGRIKRFLSWPSNRLSLLCFSETLAETRRSRGHRGRGRPSAQIQVGRTGDRDDYPRPRLKAEGASAAE